MEFETTKTSFCCTPSNRTCKHWDVFVHCIFVSSKISSVLGGIDHVCNIFAFAFCVGSTLAVASVFVPRDGWHKVHDQRRKLSWSSLCCQSLWMFFHVLILMQMNENKSSRKRSNRDKWMVFASKWASDCDWTDHCFCTALLVKATGLLSCL